MEMFSRKAGTSHGDSSRGSGFNLCCRCFESGAHRMNSFYLEGLPSAG